MGWWGPLFPSSWWGGSAGHRLFPEGISDFDAIPGNGPAGAATFTYALEGGIEVTYGWQTDVFKSFNGKEQRRSLLESPRQSYKGSAFLAGGNVRLHRSKLARYAALGQPFLLGMPWEELILTAASAGPICYVGAGLLELCDWALLGQRVIVMSNAGTSITGVVQAVSTADHSITLDVSPGSIGIAGGRIMPTMAIYLEATQTFLRYVPSEPVERWQLNARAALFGFETAALKATLDLEAPQTNSGYLDHAYLQAREAGADGNDILVTQSDDALTSGGEIIEDVGAKTVVIKYAGGDTTLAEYADLINLGSTLIRLGGTWNDADVLPLADDEFATVSLNSGADITPGTFGTGGSVTTYASKPVFDRGVGIESTASDSVQAMTELVDLGGIPASVGEAAVPDWGRQISVNRPTRVIGQWLKAFLDVVRGRFRTFWLPTDRKDMVYVSSTTVTALTRLLVSGGDVFAWYPLRKHLKIVQADNTITYTQITTALANSDGTSSLQLDVLLSGSAVTSISWLELCRLESDDITLIFKGQLVSMQQSARVVVQ